MCMFVTCANWVIPPTIGARENVFDSCDGGDSNEHDDVDVAGISRIFTMYKECCYGAIPFDLINCTCAGSVYVPIVLA